MTPQGKGSIGAGLLRTFHWKIFIAKSKNGSSMSSVACTTLRCACTAPGLNCTSQCMRGIVTVIKTLYSIIADSFDLIAHQPPMMHSTEHRPRFNFELFKEVHTAPRRTAQNPKPCSYLFEKHITMSRWTCRRGGRFTRPPYAEYPPTSVTASLQNKDAGQE